MAVAATGFLTVAPYKMFIPQESERYDELNAIVSILAFRLLEPASDVLAVMGTLPMT